MKKITGFYSAMLLAMAIATPQVHAHGIWFAQRSNLLALVYGVGADDLDTVKRKDLMTSITSYDADWQPIDTKLREFGPMMVVDADGFPAVVAATMDNGIWSKDKEGNWHKMGRDEMPDAVTSEKTMKYAVHLGYELPAKMPLLDGHTLQIIPVADKLPENMGDELTLKVLYDGKPAEGAIIVRDFVNDPDSERVKADDQKLKTGKDGTVTIQVRNQGLNVIGATYVSPPDDPKKIDKIEHFATLSFLLRHLPE